MDLLDQYLAIAAELRSVFRQRRSADRALSLMLANMLCLGRRWITRLLAVSGKSAEEWSANYKLFSRARWDSEALFDPAIRRTVPFFTEDAIVLAGDETRARKGGSKVKRSRWTRDPMSPPFHVNFMKGIRFTQFSALLPLHRTHEVDCRAVPVSFRPVDLPPRPRKGASEEQQAAYRALCKENRMCIKALDQIRHLRDAYDKAGAAERVLIASLDGGFCNQTMFRADLERTELLARCPKNAALCLPANDPSRPARVYSPEKFTPEQIRQDDQTYGWEEASVFFGGQRRRVRYKELPDVRWQGGARRRPLRLLVVAPTPYRPSPRSRTYYREPAYVLTTDFKHSATFLLQCYFDRWQIEVNHRDEKQHMGLTDPQVWNDNSVDRQPPFMVASYSFLLLASLLAYGPRRTNDYIDPPRWQRRRTRPSCQDLLALIRKQAAERAGPQADSMPFAYDLEKAVTSPAA